MKRVRRTKNEVQSQSNDPNQLPLADNSVVDDNKNPMLNSVILGHLFKVIPFNFQDFKNFRQVSKLWLEGSLGRWRQEAWIHVRESDRRQDVIPFFYKPYVEMLSLPGDPHQLLGKYAFQKYKLSGAENSCKFFNEAALLPFWSNVGPSLTHLKVINTNLGSGELLMRILTEVIPKMQFLSLERSNVSNSRRVQPYPYTEDEMRRVNIPSWNKKLFPEPYEVRTNLTRFEISYSRSYSTYSGFGVSWAYFFLRFPNIQVLKLQDVPARITGNGDNPHDELMRIFESLQMVRANGGRATLSRLKHLDLLNLQQDAVPLFRRDIVNLFSALAFPLSSLSIDIGFEQDEAGFKRILELYSLTLKKLLVYRGPYAEPFTQNFPYGVALPNLEELRFIGSICGNLDFLENTPSLKTLVVLDGQTPVETKLLHSYVEFSLDCLTHKHDSWWWRRPPRELCNKVDVISSTNFESELLKNLVLPQMEEFIVGHELCNGAHIEALGKLMPGLKRLRIGLDNEGFKAACKNWTQIRHLDLDPFDVEEEGILGIKDGEKYSQPNITDLKYLTSLRIGDHSSNDSTKGWLTQGSVVDGLLVSESLRSVWIRRAPKAKADVRRMFASRFPQ